MKLAPETSRHCKFAVTGENMNGYYPFLRGFYGPADIPTIFQEKIDRTLGHQTPVWVDIIIVTRGTKEHTRKLYSDPSKLENEGYRASKKNRNSTKKKQYGSDTHYHKKASDQTKKKHATNKLKPPTNTKTVQFFPDAIQYFAIFIPNFQEKTDNMR